MGPGSGGAGGGPGTSSRSGPPRQRPLQEAKGAKELQGSSQNLQIGTTTTIWRPSLPPPLRFSRTHPPSSARRILWVSTSSTRGLALAAGARLRVGLPGSARVNVLSVGSIRWIYPLDLSVDLRRPAECLSHSLSPSLVEVAWTEVPSPARHQPPARSRSAAPRAHLPRVSPRPLAPPAAPGSPPAEPAP